MCLCVLRLYADYNCPRDLRLPLLLDFSCRVACLTSKKGTAELWLLGWGLLGVVLVLFGVGVAWRESKRPPKELPVVVIDENLPPRLQAARHAMPGDETLAYSSHGAPSLAYTGPSGAKVDATAGGDTPSSSHSHRAVSGLSDAKVDATAGDDTPSSSHRAVAGPSDAKAGCSKPTIEFIVPDDTEGLCVAAGIPYGAGARDKTAHASEPEIEMSVMDSMTPAITQNFAPC